MGNASSKSWAGEPGAIAGHPRRSALRMLLIKHGYQLRLLRWFGLALGLVLPPVLVALAEASSRGWLPFGGVSSYSLHSLFLDALPVMYAAAWGLYALLATAQLLVGDRAAGTETFLLERPVSRTRVWVSRIVVALVSLVVVIAAHMVIWAALTQLVVQPTWPQWVQSLQTMLAIGLPVAGLGWLAGLAAASFVQAPLHSVLVGVFLLALPPATAALLGASFPHATWRGYPVGLFLPFLLGPFYVAISFAGACRGEPAGRGRLKRAIGILAVGLVVVPLTFVIVTPRLLRSEAERTFSGRWIVPSSRQSAFVGLSRRTGSGWLFESTTGQRLRFLAPHVIDVAWSPDGERLAVLHDSGPLGAAGRLRVDVFDATGEHVARYAMETSRSWVHSIEWVGSRLLARAVRTLEGPALLILEPASGEWTSLDVGGLAAVYWKTCVSARGELFVYRLDARSPVRYGLYRVDLEPARILPDPVIVEAGLTTYSQKEISPSGRYWLREQRFAEEEDEGPSLSHDWTVTDLRDGGQERLIAAKWATWMGDGDRLAWVARHEDGALLHLGVPGEWDHEVRFWEQRALGLYPSPDGKRLLIEVWRSVRSEQAAHAFGQPIAWGQPGQAWVLDVSRDEWLELTPWLDPPPIHMLRGAHWVGPDRLAQTGHGLLGLLDPSGPEPVRWILK